jgi:hypothetical protein
VGHKTRKWHVCYLIDVAVGQWDTRKGIGMCVTYTRGFPDFESERENAVIQIGAFLSPSTISLSLPN